MQKGTKQQATGVTQMSGTSTTFDAAVLDIVNRQYAGRHGAKRAARDANVSPDAVKHWFAKRRAPSASAVLSMMRANHAARLEILRLIEGDDTSN